MVPGKAWILTLAIFAENKLQIRQYLRQFFVGKKMFYL